MKKKKNAEWQYPNVNLLMASAIDYRENNQLHPHLKHSSLIHQGGGDRRVDTLIVIRNPLPLMALP